MNIIRLTHWHLDYVMWGISFKALILLIDSLEADAGIEMETNAAKMSGFGMPVIKIPKRSD